MDKEKAIEYINHQSWRVSRLGLERVDALLEKLGNPQEKLKFIHVAGTNGKGSVCSMLASVLSKAGYRAGLYTSPFINSFNERMQVNGENITDSELVELTQDIRVYADEMEDHPTEFEMITALAFEYFHRKQCDVVVLEVGLGGRLDATNIIPAPELAVITTIALDHTNELGDTLEKIAAEKAGIIKPGGDVLLYPQPAGVDAVIRGVCQQNNAQLFMPDFSKLTLHTASLGGQQFSYGSYQNLKIPLLGEFQLNNAAMVATAVDILNTKGWHIPEAAVREGMESVVWPARFEVVRQQPVFIVDGGHNPQCVDSLMQNLQRYFPDRRYIFVIGAMADKDYRTMFGKVVPVTKQMFCVTPDNPRALFASELAQTMYSMGVNDVRACPSVEAGVDAALKAATPQDVICAFGSFYMAGAIRRQLGK